MDKIPNTCGQCNYGRRYGSKVMCLKLRKMVNAKELYPGCPLKVDTDTKTN